MISPQAYLARTAVSILVRQRGKEDAPYFSVHAELASGKPKRMAGNRGLLKYAS